MFRYQVTQEQEASDWAWESFGALEFVNHISGIKGLPCRTFLPENIEGCCGGEWYNSTVYPGWKWKANTSSDEIVGHLFLYPIFYDLMAKTPQEKERAANLALDIVYYITENGYNLIDKDGKPTRWGHWSPSDLNDSPDWVDDRGTNSLQMLSYLLLAYKLNGDPYFLDHFNNLVENHGYAENMLNTKISAPNNVDHPDDGLDYPTYYAMWWGIQDLNNTFDDFYDRFFVPSVTQIFKYTKSERMSWWNIVYGATSGADDFDLESVIWCLQTWPLEQINWPTINSDRIDILYNPEPAIRNILAPDENMFFQIPYDESSLLQNDGDMWTLDGGDGMWEIESTCYILPYWKARYHNFIVNP